MYDGTWLPSFLVLSMAIDVVIVAYPSMKISLGSQKNASNIGKSYGVERTIVPMTGHKKRLSKCSGLCMDVIRKTTPFCHPVNQNIPE